MSLTYFAEPRRRSKWTPERVELLRQLWIEGYSASQIADKFKGTTFTRCSIIGKARRLKLDSRKARQPIKPKPIKPKPRAHRANGVPKPPQPPASPHMRALTFFRLKSQHCRFPLGDWFEPARLFCGADKDRREIYCPFHRRLAQAIR